MLKYLRNIIQLIFSPTSGWEDLAESDLREDESRGDISIRMLFTTCFLPLITIVSLTSFLRMFYNGGPDFLQALQQGIIEFFSLFLSYYLAIYIFSLLLPRVIDQESPVDQRRGILLVMYSLSVIAIIYLLGNIIKVRLALIQFLPFYVIYIIWKGADYIGVPERNVGAFMLVASGAILGAVYGLSFLFSILV